MIEALTVLLIFQLIGTIIAHAAGWPIPGPVIGLVLLLGLLAWRGGPSARLHETSQGLLRQLGLLFVPAGVGIVDELHVLKVDALAIAVAVPISTLLALAVTGFLMQLMTKGGR